MTMMNALKKPFSLSQGTVITGKWHRKAYYIYQKIGNGAVGTVYLSKSQTNVVALKFSENSSMIATEVNVLKTLAKTTNALGPRLLDVDDLDWQGKVVSFYAMEFIDGDSFIRFIEKNGKQWIFELVVQLLENLEKLHKAGWVFGDLKPENLIVQYPRANIRLVDVGGVTKQGRAIKEFTEFFDRGYWSMGGRKAEASYDLFSVAMIIILSFTGEKFKKKNGGIEEILYHIKKNSELKKIMPILINALTGYYQTAAEMQSAIRPFAVRNQKMINFSSLTRSGRYLKRKTVRNSLVSLTCLAMLTACGYYLFGVQDFTLFDFSGIEFLDKINFSWN